jgi:hypothetical protein
VTYNRDFNWKRTLGVNLSLLIETMCRLEDTRRGHFYLVATGDGATGFLGHVRDRETLASICVAPPAGGVTCYANHSNAWLADPYRGIVRGCRQRSARRSRAS